MFASFWRRVAASLLDCVLWLAVFAGVPFLLGLDITTDGFSWSTSLVGLIALVTSVLFDSRGGTPGKRIMNLRITDESGNIPGIRRAVLRSAFFIAFALTSTFSDVVNSDRKNEPEGRRATSAPVALDLATLFNVVLLVDIGWLIWDPNKQALHDKLAGTYVIRI